MAEPVERGLEAAAPQLAPGAADGPARVLCDWGSSRLRAFLVLGRAIAERREGPGIGELGEASSAEVLGRVLAPWRAQRRLERIVLCGMAGSRNGLAEVPYVRAPATAAQWLAGAAALRSAEDSLTLVPGIQAQNFRDGADVMRGEETQIFGALSIDSSLASGRQMMVLPGTHSKWVEVRDGRIARLQTYFTGELFELLSTRSSLLRVGAAPQPDEDAFDVGLRNAARFDLAANLFEVRSAQLIEARSAGWARSLLSGLLIGAEVQSMLALRSAALAPLTLIGDPALTARYLRALTAYGAAAHRLDGDRCVLAGLQAAAESLQES
jgi:2-dehydro-3-deoxygalactonokinase